MNETARRIAAARRDRRCSVFGVVGGARRRAGQGRRHRQVGVQRRDSAGAGAPTFTFKQDGEKLTGHYAGTFGEADVTGTVKGADITFSFAADAQGTSLKRPTPVRWTRTP